MKQARIVAALLSGLLISCVATARVGPRFYLTQPARPYHSAWSDSVIVHIDEKTEIELNARLIVGRQMGLEQGACLRVAKHVGNQYWLDSVMAVAFAPMNVTTVSISFGCRHDQAPWHAHVVTDHVRWVQCEPSGSENDQAPAFAVYPLQVLSCGIGMDSIIAWKVR